MSAGSAKAEVRSGNDQGQSKGDGTKPAWSTELPSIESVVVDGRRRIVYTGPSMNPTLSEPDLLWVERYGDRPVRVGDVVCFKSPEQDINIVHRVVSVVHLGVGPPTSSLLPPHSTHIRTRGDNNLWPDPDVLATDDLLGRVVSAQRGSRLRPIPGGHAGRMVALSVRLRKSIMKALISVASGAYQSVVRSGPFDFLLPGELRPRLVSFQGREITTLKLLMGSRMVANYDHRFNQWRIRRPYRLFVNEQTLPNPESPSPNPQSR